MKRFSMTLVIHYEDLETGMCQKKEIVRDNIRYIEYWCYAKRVKRIQSKIVSVDGKPYYSDDIKDVYLNCIVVCDGTDHIVDKGAKSFMVMGLRLDGEDINNYLKKTGRHSDKVDYKMSTENMRASTQEQKSVPSIETEEKDETNN